MIVSSLAWAYAGCAALYCAEPARAARAGWPLSDRTGLGLRGLGYGLLLLGLALAVEIRGAEVGTALYLAVLGPAGMLAVGLFSTRPRLALSLGLMASILAGKALAQA